MATNASTALPAPPAASAHPFVQVLPGAVVCSEAVLEGPHTILIGANAIVHPRAVLSARLGPITLGANCVVEECAILRATNDGGISLGASNLLRVACVVEADLGTGNVVDVRAVVPASSGLGNGCVVGCGVVLDAPLGDNTVAFRSGGGQGGVAHRFRPDQLAMNLDDIRPKDALRDMLTTTHRVIH
jgi:carbonic anhydrase/acetyltransferase-like protein (isoleucine patch superfamily)